MKERILLVGEDPSLLATRALLLSDWETETVNTFQATKCIEAEIIDLVIIGHTVPKMDAKVIIGAAQRLKPPPEVLVIRSTGENDEYGVETHANDLWESPEWLRKSVVELLTRRKSNPRTIPQSASTTEETIVV